MKIFLFSIILSFLSSCASKKIVNGNLPDADTVSILEIGKDNKGSILKILGEPSFKGSLGDNSYYYVGSLKTKIAFLKSKVK